MRRNIKVRGRDGAIREVDDHYILQDGETMLGRTAVHGCDGGP